MVRIVFRVLQGFRDVILSPRVVLQVEGDAIPVAETPCVSRHNLGSVDKWSMARSNDLGN